MWGSLELDKDSFIDPDLRKHYADLLFSMRVRGVEIRVYVLLEHQRGVEKRMMLRLLVYMTRVWERLVRDDPGGATIPVIFPVLLHNSKSGWSAETSFEKIVALPEHLREELLPHTPRFEAALVDLSPARATAIADDWLTAFGRLVLWALSVAGDDARFLAEIGQMKDAIAGALAAPDGYEALSTLLRYISLTHERLGTKRVEKALTAVVGKDEQRVIMSMLEMFEEKGRVKGRVEGRAKMLLDQLSAKFGPTPAEAKARVMDADEATLRRWSLRLLTEDTLASVLDSAKPKPARKATPGGKHARASRA
jgi:predicted transposase YdaD